MPTSPKQQRVLLDSLPPDLHGKVIDLGSGWGTLAIGLAKRFPSCQITGYESSPVPHYVSEVLLLLLRYPNLKFVRKDIYELSVGDAVAVTCYLYPVAMTKLKSKLETELRPGTIVITNTFAVPDWKPEKIAEVADIYRSKIYFYQR